MKKIIFKIVDILLMDGEKFGKGVVITIIMIIASPIWIPAMLFELLMLKLPVWILKKIRAWAGGY